MLVHRSIKFAGTHLYTWVERGTVRVKCLAQEHNTMSPARARTRSARSGVERTNHEATAPPRERKPREKSGCAKSMGKEAREKRDPPFARFSFPGFRAAISIWKGIIYGHSRRTKGKMDLSQSTIPPTISKTS